MAVPLELIISMDSPETITPLENINDPPPHLSIVALALTIVAMPSSMLPGSITEAQNMPVTLFYFAVYNRFPGTFNDQFST